METRAGNRTGLVFRLLARPFRRFSESNAHTCDIGAELKSKRLKVVGIARAGCGIIVLFIMTLFRLDRMSANDYYRKESSWLLKRMIECEGEGVPFVIGSSPVRQV